MKNMNIIPVESKTHNPVLIRMNCLALACLDDVHANKISLAIEYEKWVYSGKAQNYANVAIGDSAYSDLKKSGVFDSTQVPIKSSE
jgi:hypothetical protein